MCHGGPLGGNLNGPCVRRDARVRDGGAEAAAIRHDASYPCDPDPAGCIVPWVAMPPVVTRCGAPPDAGRIHSSRAVGVTAVNTMLRPSGTYLGWVARSSPA